MKKELKRNKSLYLSDKVIEKFDKLVEKEGRSASKMLETLIDFYNKKNKPLI